ncbi:hypothetical protein Q4512_04270 [Oceanihabitans sp. 2_MG-2023]|uniref:OmpA family protein n=1 Tax=Oceanihabitans sp. 2_MG-2023 TaxID=3062661 RepID=UPI0026E2C116|nr:OmpA family protein [Oceanihabitans sp. 2_MG-2023]MDO6596118.1 hypothetical protein [Oceanihabitans sp. 2_MG-2023]
MYKIITFFLFIYSINCWSQNNGLPVNPQLGKCYVKCHAEDILDWKIISCDLLLKDNKLPISITSKTEVISNRDKKIIDKKIVKLIKKEFVVLIEVHHDSHENEGVNMKASNKKAQIILEYLDGLDIPKEMVWVNYFGNTKAKNKCLNKTFDCDKLYQENSKITYKVVSAGKPKEGMLYKYDDKEEIYYWSGSKK